MPPILWSPRRQPSDDLLLLHKIDHFCSFMSQEVIWYTALRSIFRELDLIRAFVLCPLFDCSYPLVSHLSSLRGSLRGDYRYVRRIGFGGGPRSGSGDSSQSTSYPTPLNGPQRITSVVDFSCLLVLGRESNPTRAIRTMRYITIKWGPESHCLTALSSLY